MTSSANADQATGLFQSERQREILTLTMRAGRVEVADLADRFGVTTETIRRDLSNLQQQQMVRRVHGGAIPWETAGFEPLLSIRTDQQDTEKRRLAGAAVDELPPSGAIIIDSGSTGQRFAEALPITCDLHVITNSLATGQALAEHPAVEVTVLGGTLRKNTLAMVDADAAHAIRTLNVDTLFISCDGFTPTDGLTTPYRDEATIKRSMIRSARRVVALVDHSKAGKTHLVRFAAWADVDVLVTNHEVDPDTVAEIEAMGTTVRLA